MARARRDINTLSDSELSDYIHAIDILRQRSVVDTDDPAGFDFQAGLHNDPLIGPCEHGSDLFMPWHRAHLHYFEKLLQEADPPRTSTVTIPYWDWIHVQPVGKFPPAFDQPGLASPGRRPDHDSLPSDTLSIVTTITEWKRFGGYPQGDPDGDYGDLEYGPHNFMHPGFIGGKMAHPSTAAEDPIYFSFHCFIDLLWAEWQRRNGMPPPTSPDADLRGFLTQPKHTVADFQDAQQLNYVYEYTDQLKAAFATEVPAKPLLRKRVEIQPLEPAFDKNVTEQLLDTGRLAFRLAAPPSQGAVVLVRLEKLKVPQKGSFMLRGYFHPQDVPFDDSDEAFTEQYSVGYVVMWQSHSGMSHSGMSHGEHGGHAPHPHHPTSCIARFDVTRMLDAEAPLADHLLTLRYVPLPDAADAAEVIKEVALDQVLMEVYG
jgi:hypothetical protein